jgi:nicotinate-nucleotide adenylyltransferase
MRVGLYFGSFNPVHIGHLAIAEAVREEAKLDRLWLVVSPQNPFKEKLSLLNAHDRLLLCELATASNPALEANNVEFGLPPPSYTADTLDHLTLHYPGYAFSLVMGQDTVLTLPKWRRPERILSQEIWVYQRPEAPPIPAEMLASGRIHLLTGLPMINLSATEIRQRLAEGRSVRYLVPDAALEMILAQGLYRQP